MIVTDLVERRSEPTAGRKRRGPTGWQPAKGTRLPEGSLPTVLCLAAAAIVVVGLVFAGPARLSGPIGLFLFAIAAAIAAATLGSPITALVLLLFASFTRPGIPIAGLPADQTVLLTGAVVAAVLLAWSRGLLRVRLGWLEAAMLAYVGWNTVSALLPHEFPAAAMNGTPYLAYRYILSGTIMPFLAYIVGRAVLRDAGRIKIVLCSLLIMTAYSAATAILQFTGPTELVWPRYIVTSPGWPGRANGIFDQPVVNGLVMVVGFAIAVLVMHEKTLARYPRILAGLVAVLAAPGIYLTKTRAVWLIWVLSLVACAIFARGRRVGFMTTIAVAVAFVGATWSEFTSADRSAGGVASSAEVNDRLNAAATAFWAIEQKPWMGWGVGRFAQVNTYHHRAWDASVSFNHGLGIPAHENELGIWTDLGLIGLVLWVLVLVLVGYALFQAIRQLAAADGLAGYSLGVLAASVLGTWVVCGFMVDLRFFDFANLLVFLLVGAAVGRGESLGSTQASGSFECDREVSRP